MEHHHAFHGKTHGLSMAMFSNNSIKDGDLHIFTITIKKSNYSWDSSMNIIATPLYQINIPYGAHLVR